DPDVAATDPAAAAARYRGSTGPGGAPARGTRPEVRVAAEGATQGGAGQDRARAAATRPAAPAKEARKEAGADRGRGPDRPRRSGHRRGVRRARAEIQARAR